MNETDLSTFESLPQAHARLPRADEHARRARGLECPARQRAQARQHLNDAGGGAGQAAGQPADRRLPRHVLLRRRRDFLRIFAAGRRQHGTFMSMIAYQPEHARGEDGQRVAALARKKEFRHAVDRNRVKRRLREVARLNRACLRPDLWLVLQARIGALRAPWPALCDEFMALCQAARLVREEPHA